jgi:hypothetical protein
MRISMRGWLTVAAIFFAAVLTWVVWSWPPSRTVSLADGSQLRIERVSFGKRDTAFKPEVSEFESVKKKLAAYLPKAWAARIPVKGFPSSGNWWRWAIVHTNEDALHIWITQRDPTNGFEAVQAGAAEIVDEDGYVYLSTQEGGDRLSAPMMGTGWGPMQSELSWFTFEAFPRHERKMRLRLYSSYSGGIDPSGKFLAEFQIMNPLPKANISNSWVTEFLPIEKRYGEISFILKDVGYKTNWVEGQTNSTNWNRPWQYSRNPVEIVPKFEVLERGGRTLEWEPLDLDLRGNSGNIAPRMWGDYMSVFLSPRESAWKLAVKFFASERESAASNSVWVMRNLQVPGAGAFTPLTNEKELDGVQVAPVALAGPGEAVYDDDKLTRITASNSAAGNSISFGMTHSRSFNNSTTEEIVDTVTPYIAVYLDGLNDDQRLTIRAVTTGNEEYYAKPWSYGNNTTQTNRIYYLTKDPNPYHLGYFLLDLPSDVKTVDLYFCVHHARTVEFVFKPPQP